MASEEEPLLPDQHELTHERFSPPKKRVLVVIVSWVAFVAFLASGAFVASIPQLIRDLNVTGRAIRFAIGISALAAPVGGLLGSKYAKFYGRRSAYLWSLPVMITGSLGIATARNVTQILIWQFVQVIGASPGLSVGVGVVGDIYELEERGTALGCYFGAGLLGLALAPVIGVVTSHFSWRATHCGLATFALVAFLWILSSVSRNRKIMYGDTRCVYKGFQVRFMY